MTRAANSGNKGRGTSGRVNKNRNWNEEKTHWHTHTLTREANQMEADAACSSRGSDVKQVSLCLFAEEPHFARDQCVLGGLGCGERAWGDIPLLA